MRGEAVFIYGDQTGRKCSVPAKEIKVTPSEM